MRHVVLAACFAASLATVSHGAGSDLPLRQFELPDHGVFDVAVPADWQHQVAQPPNRLPPTIEFRPKSGPPFKILMTPLWAMEGATPNTDAKSIRDGVERAAKGLSGRAVETSITVHELVGTSGTGAFFSATDKAPKPGEFKYLTQGVLPVGQLIVTFSILTNDGQGATVKAGLEVMKSAVNKR